MRKSDPAVSLGPEPAAAADSGVKAMIPIGRPFLDYVLGVAADAGYHRACLVVGPEHGQMQNYYTELRPRRMTIDFAVQVEPLGTADAVAAAESRVGRRPFTMINSDNYYPPRPLRGLREAAGAGRGRLRPEDLGGRKQYSARADLEVRRGRGNRGRQPTLKRIIEKPDEATLARLPRPLGVSMNCWRFAPAIFEACRSIGRSPRGELEIPDAVQYVIDRLGEPFHVCAARPRCWTFRVNATSNRLPGGWRT